MEYNFKREVSCFLIPNNKVLSVTTNNSGGYVEFDFFSIWSQLKQIEHDDVCMIHTHPSGFPVMSSTDKNMVHGWAQAIGKPIYFIILSDNNVTCYYYYKEDKIIKSKLIEIETNIIFDCICEIIKKVSCEDECVIDSEESIEEFLKIINNIFKIPFICEKKVIEDGSSS